MTRIGWRVKLGAILTVVIAIAAAVAVLATSGPSDADSSTISRRALAAREATRLIAAVRIPDEVTTAASQPEPETASALARLSRAAGPVTVERSGAWSVPRSAAAVRTYLATHPPAGTRSVRGTPLTFVATRAPARLAAAGLVVTVATTGPRSSAVHADALVRWVVARPAAERIPARAHELEILRGSVGHAPSLVVRLTAPPQITRIRTLLDRLAIVQPGRVYHCPARFPEVPVVSFVFRSGGPGSRVLASATEQADVRSPTTACDAMRVTVAGHAQPPLLGGYGLLRQVSAMLGRRLWTRPYAA